MLNNCISYFINNQFIISKLLRYLQTGYLGVASGVDHLESVSKWLINVIDTLINQEQGNYSCIYKLLMTIKLDNAL